MNAFLPHAKIISRTGAARALGVAPHDIDAFVKQRIVEPHVISGTAFVSYLDVCRMSRAKSTVLGR